MATTYSVLVGNVGWCLQREPDEEKSRSVYAEYVAIARGKYGIGHRGYNEQVTLWRDNTSHDSEPIAEFFPDEDDEDDDEDDAWERDNNWYEGE